MILASDNGPWLPAGSAYPLTGWKYTTMEGGHRVPAMIRWPGKIPAGQVSDQLVSALDLLPTIAAATGASLPTDRKYDGYNLMPLLSGKTDKSPRQEFAYYNGLTLEVVPTLAAKSESSRWIPTASRMWCSPTSIRWRRSRMRTRAVPCASNWKRTPPSSH